MNLQKIPTCSIFSNDLRAVLLRYQIPHKIDIFPGKITFAGRNLQKIPTCSIFSNDLRAVLLRYQIPHKIDIFPGKITFSINGSVNSKRAHSSTPPPPRTFVQYLSSCFGKSANTPQWGLKWGTNAPPRDNTKIVFPVYFPFPSCKYHIYGKSVII